MFSCIIFILQGSASWKEISQFSTFNSDFTGCGKRILDIVRSSKSVSTNKKYDIYFNKFKKWCIRYSVNSLPASVATVAVYLSGLVQQSVSESVLLAHFYSIKWYHDFSLFDNPCEDRLIQLMVEGAKRILSRPLIKKEPITPQHLHELIKKLTSDRTRLPNVRICNGFAQLCRFFTLQ